MKAGFRKAVHQLLEDYGDVDVNFKMFQSSQTPLEHAAAQEDVDLVKLILDKGADATSPAHAVPRARGGPALVRAVNSGNQELVKALVRHADRVHRTRALGRAVDLQDRALVDILLANGAQCEFENSDLPRPRPAHILGVTNVVDMHEFLPPLVHAVILGDADLVRVLLSHGADANVGYHDLKMQGLPGGCSVAELISNICCGRAVQLAMELGQGRGGASA
ncbi:hypothetical protein VMCG_03662 [Cytospora schulzeri]|uniref:Uncharacterized protein n=1 Tax=Cytospora schulzeri TaxID=448051 RepID=A0A423WWK0_9PEZI|nr:hypothetical protein VMCG_03662 [Valsa malicola]